MSCQKKKGDKQEIEEINILTMNNCQKPLIHEITSTKIPILNHAPPRSQTLINKIILKCQPLA